MRYWWEAAPVFTAYLLLFAFFVGAVWASFCACAAARSARGESFLKGRSHCDACGHVLAARDLVPVFSYLASGGRCRYCKAKIPLLCPVSEGICGIFFALLLWQYGLTAQFCELLVFSMLLAAMSLADWESGILPDSLQLLSALNFAAFALWRGGLRQVGYGLAGGLLLFVPLLLLTLVMDRVLGRESMGGGDLKLFFVVGLYFPHAQLLLIVLLSCIIGILLTLLTKKTTGDEENPAAFPFGPSIALAAGASMLWGERIITWYLGLF